MPIYRRIFKTGNSVVISLPAYVLDQQGVEVGDYFIVKSQPDVGVFLRPAKAEEKNSDRWARKGVDRSSTKE
jgi:antitoxin component of MazEF toxin-antitoxin module